MLLPLAPQICNAVILVLVSVIKQIKPGRRQDEIYMYMCNHKYLCTDISFLAVPCLQCSHVKLSEKKLPDINQARMPVEPSPEHRFLRTLSHLPFPPLPTLNGRGPISLALASMHPQGRRSFNISSKRIWQLIAKWKMFKIIGSNILLASKLKRHDITKNISCL